MVVDCNFIFHIFSDKGEALSWGGGGSGRLGHGHQSSIFGFLRSSRFYRCLSLVILLGISVFTFTFTYGSLELLLGHLTSIH